MKTPILTLVNSSLEVKDAAMAMKSFFPQPATRDEAAIEPALVQIPEGWFLMGSETGQDCERPVHGVWIDSFHLAATQVTNAEYNRFLRTTSALPPPFWHNPDFNHPAQPVAGVAWFEASRYCEWLSVQTGRAYRLPTEAEWERAARGGLEQKQFPWGDDPPQSLPNYAIRWQNGPETVGCYAPNGFGLYDICDNVHEWCSDWYDPNCYASSPERNPQGPEQSSMQPPRKASRGGSWRHHIKVARCSARSSIPPEFQYADYGFRIASE
ncbi:MAG TPA: SUMF1/EgtB/PvdO family nonheme iron enzyme [Candidatus Acidoferrum sp.]|nr:SUMF1/EgtB/PvdO family nonheme iron enzyme [Candidatus Acidoferrum sp.]